MKSKFVREVLGRDDEEASRRLFAYLKLVLEIDSQNSESHDRIQDIERGNLNNTNI
jgi:hypothetical protein